MQLVVSDPKTKKAYTKKIENPVAFTGKKIGEEMELGIIGIDGYTGKITGGSDKQGFPMKKDLQGTARKKIVIIDDKKSGSKRKISKRGNTISDEITQLNMKVTKYGPRTLEEIFSGVEKVVKKTDEEIKQEMIEKSHEGAEGLDPKSVKGKVRR